VPAPTVALRQPYLRFLPEFLFRDDGARLPYALKAWVLALLPSLALSFALFIISPEAERPEFAASGLMLAFLLVVFAPVVETLLMTPPLLLLARLLGPGPAVVASAIGWGVLHSLAAPVWGLIVWWSFLILSIALLNWRSKGLVRAMLTVTAIHALQNSVPAALLMLSEPAASG
jgi:membrane protease YdiL (CAAX protease family)